MIINYFVLLLTRYTCVNALNSQCEIKKDSRKIRKILNFLFGKKPKQNYLEKTIKFPQKWALWQLVASVSAQRHFKIAHARW